MDDADQPPGPAAKPTPEMIEAGARVLYGYELAGEVWSTCLAKEVYEAMMSARPSRDRRRASP